VSEIDVARDLFLYWLKLTYEREFAPLNGGEAPAIATAGATRLAIEVRPLLDVSGDKRWNEACAELEGRLAEEVPAAIAVWVPFGARLPVDEPYASEFVDLVAKTAVKLGPRERSYARLPIELRLRKNADSGGVVSATGGLNQHWARFTEHVRGQYDLDSTALHRLPESEDHLQELIDTIVARTKEMEVGQVVAIETFDAWTVQRAAGKHGATIIGVPPQITEDLPLDVRRSVRRIVTECGPRLRGADADLRALVMLGYYGRIEQETVTTAMRGYDPSLYAGIDFICLVADGVVKPLIHAPATAFSS
jgi:hypothetical protein